MDSVIVEKKLDEWSYSTDNMVANGEITVTITLREYRDLVKRDAISQHNIDKANSERYKAQQENETLKNRVRELESMVFNLQMSIENSNASEVKS